MIATAFAAPIFDAWGRVFLYSGLIALALIAYCLFLAFMIRCCQFVAAVDARDEKLRSAISVEEVGDGH